MILFIVHIPWWALLIPVAIIAIIAFIWWWREVR